MAASPSTATTAAPAPATPAAAAAVFTIALGRPIYLRMALALARSVLRHNPGIAFTLVTDHPVAARPKDLAAIAWAIIPDGAYGRGFTPKLHLDRLAPADRALFVDADCLCVGSLAPAFAAFAGRPVGVIGRTLTAGEWFGDVAAIAARLGLAGYPRFNGGVYYLQRGAACTAIYDTARALLPSYDALGFRRLRGTENDEVLMAAAMALGGAEPVAETGTIMNTVMAAPGGVALDALAGGSLLRNPRGHPRHAAFEGLEAMAPALVHFCGEDLCRHPYRTEVVALERVAAGWPAPLARGFARLVSELPFRAASAGKTLMRPLFHRLFGPRAVRRSARLETAGPGPRRAPRRPAPRENGEAPA